MGPTPTLTVGEGWVVVEDGARGPAVAAQHDEVALVVGGAAEAAVAAGGEAAVLGGAGAELAVQHPRVHQHDGHVALRQVRLDVLDAHRAAGEAAVTAPPHLSSDPAWTRHPAWGQGSSLPPSSLLSPRAGPVEGAPRVPKNRPAPSGPPGWGQAQTNPPHRGLEGQHPGPSWAE